MPKCRYCWHLQMNGMSGGPRCEIHNKDVSESYAKKKRECDDYKLVTLPDEEKDYFMESVYKGERSTKTRQKEGHQMTIDEV